LLVVVLFLFVVAGVCVAIQNVEELKFKLWTMQHNKNYDSSEEYSKRFDAFKSNLKRINTLNQKKGQTAVYGLDRFSDMTVEEFTQQKLLNRFDPANTCRWPYHRVHPLFSQDQLDAIPTSFDWRKKGAVTAVKNQQSCGSCWTFSTAENIEGQWQIAGNALVSLSEQWIVDCSHSCLVSESDLCNGGCGGGLPWLAYEDIIANKFLTTEAAYQYTGVQGTCQ